MLVAAGDPEATVIADAPPANVFGVKAPVAMLEHLLVMYLYSNQPRHLGDFAAIVLSGKADLSKAERSLRDMHPSWARPGSAASRQRSRRRLLLHARIAGGEVEPLGLAAANRRRDMRLSSCRMQGGRDEPLLSL